MISNTIDLTEKFNNDDTDPTIDISGMDVVIVHVRNLTVAGFKLQVSQYGGESNTQNSSPSRADYFSDVVGVNLADGTLKGSFSAASGSQQVKLDCVGRYLRFDREANAVVDNLFVTLIKKS